MHTDLCDRFGIEYPIFVFTPSEKVAALIKKVKTNRFGAPKPPPAALEPKALPQPAAPEGGAEGEAPAEGGEG